LCTTRHRAAGCCWRLSGSSRPTRFAAEIIKRCTGKLTFGEIVDDLAKSYTAPREKIRADVGTLLRGLADKRLLEL
jgi:hypothetical protein